MLNLRKIVAGSVLFVNCFGLGSFAHAVELKAKPEVVDRALAKEIARTFIGAELLARKTNKLNEQFNKDAPPYFGAPDSYRQSHDSVLITLAGGATVSALSSIGLMSDEERQASRFFSLGTGLMISSAFINYIVLEERRAMYRNAWESEHVKEVESANAKMQNSVETVIDDTAYIFGRRLDDKKKREEIKSAVFEKMRSDAIHTSSTSNSTRRVSIIDIFADHGLITSSELMVFNDLQTLTSSQENFQESDMALLEENKSELVAALMSIKKQLNTLPFNTNLKSEERKELQEMRKDILASIDRALEILDIAPQSEDQAKTPNKPQNVSIRVNTTVDISTDE